MQTARLSSTCRVKPFGSSFVSSRRFAAKANAQTGCKWTMKKKDSYLLEVELGEDEPEEYAIRRFSRLVLNSNIINEMRRRRRVMTKIEYKQAKQVEKHLLRKLKFEPPTWKEDNAEDGDISPFAEYFNKDDDVSYLFDPNKQGLDDTDIFQKLKDEGYAFGGGFGAGFGGGYSSGQQQRY